jgi:tripartite-type tricarboxylate transporter receptor subunit TctC
MNVDLFLALACAILSCATAPARAADARPYPDRPVRIVAGQQAGTATDNVSRTIADALAEHWGVAVVVENRPGAGGTIGAEAVANAAPDGYTLLLAGLSNLVIGPATRTDVRYDPVRDFVAIGRVAHVPYGLAVNASVPARSLRELADLARANPGKLTYATLGAGTTNNYGMALFRKAANLDMLGVEYKGASSMTIDVVAGRVDAYFNEIAAVWQHAQSGALRILAIASPKRISRAPDIPTTAEQGFPSVVVAPWYGLLAPAGTPPEIVRRLESAYAAAMRSPTTRRRIEALGYEPIDDEPGHFAEVLRDDLAGYRASAPASRPSAPAR